MLIGPFWKRLLAIAPAFALSATLSAQTPKPPTHAQLLRGAYDRYRANNHLLSYHLDIRVDPAAKTVQGKNTIRFRMLQDDDRIQLDLTEDLNVDKIVLGKTELKYERDSGAVFVDFPEKLHAGKTVSVDFYYSGKPREQGRFGGIVFDKDPSGHPWVNTACEGTGASVWWPNKDQWRDKVENMQISVAIPSDLVDVSNGKFMGKTDLKDGYTRWDWMIHYPIDNYCVSINVGNYVHFSDKAGKMPVDFYVLPEHLDKAKKQFAQVPGMIAAYEHFFGQYPFIKDGYKLIEVPYTGMEHQSAVTYGNRFANGYYGNDWTGVGISLRFDFIIIHESGHEWFGNAISAADPADMWIHEGWTTYLECLYCEYMYGKADGLKYTNGYKMHVRNRNPILAQRGINAEEPDDDQYFKGALFLNTMRSVIDDDKRWFALIHDLFQHFKYHAILTEDIVAFFNQKLHANMTPIFDEYLRHAALPTLELKFGDGAVDYRWKVDEPAFNMPIKVGTPDHWQVIKPTTTWQTMSSPLKGDAFQVATDLYYVKVEKQ